MENHLPIRMLSTRALSNAAHDFVNRRGWLTDMVSFIETHGIVTAEKLGGFVTLTGDEGLLIFTSENGVKWLKWGLDKFGFHFPGNKKAWFVGEKAMTMAVEWLKVIPVGFERNASKLLETLKGMYSAGQPIFFVCGTQRLETLPAGLREAGFNVVEFPVYETVHTPHKIIRDYDAVLFFSPSAVESYFKVNTWNAETLAVSIGQTTARALRNKGVEAILVAAEPGELAMLAGLEHYFTEKRFK